MINVKGSVIDKDYGTNENLSNISVYSSDEKGKPIQPMQITKSDNNGLFNFNVDDNVKFISARVSSDNIITKDVKDKIVFDFSQKSKPQEVQEVIVSAKKPIKIEIPLKEISEKKVIKNKSNYGILIGAVVVFSVFSIYYYLKNKK